MIKKITLNIGYSLYTSDHIITSECDRTATINMLHNMAHLLEYEKNNCKFIYRNTLRKPLKKSIKYETINEGFGHRPYGSK